MSAFGPKWTFRGGIKRKTLLSVKRPSSSGGEKVPHFVKESAPNRVSLQNHVIAAFKCDEARAADTRRDPTPLTKRLRSIVTAMEHKGRSGHAWSRSVTSISSNVRRSLAASGDVVMRCKSLNESICAVVASGMKSDVNIWRKAGLS